VAACCARLGRLDEAREARDAVAARAPGFGAAQLRHLLPAPLADLLEAGWQLLESPAS
jgi:hypothetical protein